VAQACDVDRSNALSTGWMATITVKSELGKGSGIIVLVPLQADGSWSRCLGFVLGQGPQKTHVAAFVGEN